MTQGLLQAILPHLDRGDCPNSRWPDGKGEHHSLCPFHDDHRSGSFSVSERGYKCFSCGESGGLRKLAEKLGVELPPTKRGLTLQQYADAKRLPVGFLKSLGMSEVRERRGNGQTPVLHMPYKDVDARVLRVRRRLALSKPKRGRDNRFRWARGQGVYLYGLWRLAKMRSVGWILLVEGESDCHTAWLQDIPALGVPGADAWKSQWASHLDDLDVFAWREPDDGGCTFIANLRDDLPSARVIIPPEGVKDISQAHIKGQDIVALVEKLKTEAVPIAEMKPFTQAAKTLADLAPWVRSRLGKRASRETKVQVAETIADWLLAHERLLVDVAQDQAKGGRPYLVADDGALWPLERDAVSTRLTLYEAGLNASERSYSFVLEALTMEAYRHGQRVRLSRWQEARDGALYVSCGPTRLVRVQCGKSKMQRSCLTRLPNGTDGVWFAGDLSYPEWQPSEAMNPLELPAFNPCLEAPDEVPSYTARVQCDLLSAWLAGLLSGLRPLPLLVAVGQKGGGKTTLTKAVMRALLGSAARPTLLSDDKRDYWALVTTMPVVGFDNVDSDVPSWFPDTLAATVTGVNVDQREFYTNGVRLSRPVTAAVVISSRTASFARADVAERTLPLLTGEFEDADRVADADLLAQVDAHRDGILSWCTLTASRLLAERHQAPPGLPLRFVDYARMGWAYMRQQGQPEMAARMLLALRQAQSLVVGEADPLVEALVLHFDDLVLGGTWRGSASQLVRDLTAGGADLPYLGGGKKIARQLREAKATLRLMGVQLKEEPHGHGTQFTLWRSAVEKLEKLENSHKVARNEAHNEGSSYEKVLEESQHSQHSQRTATRDDLAPRQREYVAEAELHPPP